MASFAHHLFVCGNVRAADHPRGCCDPEGADHLRDAFKAELKRQGLASSSRANSAGCLDQCEHGPTVVIYPQNIWYGWVRVEDVPRIVEQTIMHGVVLEDLLIQEICLNNPRCEHRLGARRRRCDEVAARPSSDGLPSAEGTVQDA